MLFLTGYHPKLQNGKVFDNEQVNANILIQAFDIPTSTYAEFRIGETHRKAKENDTQIHRAQGFMLSPKINLGTLEVRYSTGRRKDEKVGYVYETAKMLDFHRTEMLVFNTTVDTEKYVWYFLANGNGSNPLRNKNKPVMYSYYNREGEAQKAIERSVLLMDVISEIGRMDIESMRIIAAGLRYNVGNVERIVPRIQESGENELRHTLLQLAMADKDVFVDNFKAGSSKVIGMLKHAIDNGLIEIERQNWGANWKWKIPSHDNTVIVAVNKGENDFAALQAAFMNHFQDLYPILHNAIMGMQTKAMAEKHDIKLATPKEITLDFVETMALDRLLEKAVLADIVAFDRPTKAVFLVIDGEFEESPFLHIEDKSRWKEEVVAFLGSSDEQSKVWRERLTTAIHQYIGQNLTNTAPPIAPTMPKAPGADPNAKPRKKNEAPTGGPNLPGQL